MPVLWQTHVFLLKRCVLFFLTICLLPQSLVIQWKFVQRIDKQMSNFMKGFNEIVPQRCILMFDPKELEVDILNFKLFFTLF